MVTKMSLEKHHQFLSKKKFDTYTKLRNLTEGIKVDVKEPEIIFKRIADLLENTGERGRIQFNIRIGEERQYWCLELDEKTCSVNKKKFEKPELEISTQAKTWLKVAEGTISPIEAIAKGKLSFRGDLELGLRLFKLLPSTKGKIAPCL